MKEYYMLYWFNDMKDIHSEKWFYPDLLLNKVRINRLREDYYVIIEKRRVIDDSLISIENIGIKSTLMGGE